MAMFLSGEEVTMLWQKVWKKLELVKEWVKKSLSSFSQILHISPIFRAQPDWACEFPYRTGPDDQICRTGLAWPDCIRTYIFKHFTYQVRIINSHKIRSLGTNLVSTVNKQKKVLKKFTFCFFQFFFYFFYF